MENDIVLLLRNSMTVFLFIIFLFYCSLLLFIINNYYDNILSCYLSSVLIIYLTVHIKPCILHIICWYQGSTEDFFFSCYYFIGFNLYFFVFDIIRFLLICAQLLVLLLQLLLTVVTETNLLSFCRFNQSYHCV